MYAANRSLRDAKVSFSILRDNLVAVIRDWTSEKQKAIYTLPTCLLHYAHHIKTGKCLTTKGKGGWRKQPSRPTRSHQFLCPLDKILPIFNERERELTRCGRRRRSLWSLHTSNRPGACYTSSVAF